MSFTIGLLVAGPKGRLFLESFLKELDLCIPDKTKISICSSYAVRGLRDDSLSAIESLCKNAQVLFVPRGDFRNELIAKCDTILVAGWQFLLDHVDDRFVVFHDSLLPKLRGFNPTVTALLLGDQRIGVSAFRPLNGCDEGPVYGSESLEIEYPITIAEAYHRLGKAYCKLALELVSRARDGRLCAIAQDPSQATYSLWRDEEDYTIDWQSDSAQIRRFIDAVGWPYMGAKTTFQNGAIRIFRAECIEDLNIPQRAAGKVWAVGRGGGLADVVCGSGMLRIIDARTDDDQPIVFDKVRRRLGVGS